MIESRVLPRWLGWALVVASPFLLLQGFGLGGVIASFGLILDLLGFLLFLIFVLVRSLILLTPPPLVPDTVVVSSRQADR